MPALDKWDSFYIIVGPAAGALIGLQFVVMTLIAERPPLRVAETGAAFATPTIVHFSVVLFLAALLRAPWESIVPPAVGCGLVGIGGIAYSVVTARHMRASSYKPDFEDLVYYLILPWLAYVALLAAAIVAYRYLQPALFVVGGVSLLLLFCGIHNSWDAIAFHVLVQRNQDDTHDQ
jgi:hypothetical protein